MSCHVNVGAEDACNTRIQRNCQHWAHKMKINKTKQKEQSKTDNSEKLSTLGRQYEDKQNKNTTQYALDTTLRKQTQIT
jgi:hypothetical protein